MEGRTYLDHSLFDDIPNSSIRVWNRCMTLCNLKSDVGEVEGYVGRLTEWERKECALMLNYINTSGYELVKSKIIKGQ